MKKCIAAVLLAVYCCNFTSCVSINGEESPWATAAVWGAVIISVLGEIVREISAGTDSTPSSSGNSRGGGNGRGGSSGGGNGGSSGGGGNGGGGNNGGGSGRQDGGRDYFSYTP